MGPSNFFRGVVTGLLLGSVVATIYIWYAIGVSVGPNMTEKAQAILFVESPFIAGSQPLPKDSSRVRFEFSVKTAKYHGEASKWDFPTGTAVRYEAEPTISTPSRQLNGNRITGPKTYVYYDPANPKNHVLETFTHRRLQLAHHFLFGGLLLLTLSLAVTRVHWHVKQFE